MFDGIRDVALSGYFIVIALTGLILGMRALIAFFIITCTVVVSAFYAENAGLLVSSIGPVPEIIDLVTVLLTLGLTAMLTGAAMQLITEIQMRLQQGEREYRQLVESANSIILRMDVAGRITFFNQFAHNFNNILSAIIGFTELALDDAPKESKQKESLLEVLSAGKRARDLVGQILIFARHPEKRQKAIRIAAEVRRVVDLLRATIPTDIRVTERIDSPSRVMADPSQIQQLFMNLCTNAVQAMEAAGGVLDIELTDVVVEDRIPAATAGLTPGKYVKAVVSDTGPGIPRDVIDAIFDPYFSTRSVGEGLGMGQAVVHGIVEYHGGEITVDSRQGKGAEFTVSLPVISN